MSITSSARVTPSSSRLRTSTADTSSTPPLLQLSPELQALIAAHLPAQSFVRMIGVCKKFETSLRPEDAFNVRHTAAALCDPTVNLATISKIIENYFHIIQNAEPEQAQETVQKKLNALNQAMQIVFGNPYTQDMKFANNIGRMLSQSALCVDPEIANSFQHDAQPFPHDQIKQFAQQIEFALSCTDKSTLKEQILGNASEVLQARLSSDSRKQIASNTEASPTMLDVLSRDAKFDVKHEAANNSNIPPHRLAALSKDSHDYVRFGAASNINNTPEELTQLTQDTAVIVRLGAVRNPTTPQPQMMLC